MATASFPKSWNFHYSELLQFLQTTYGNRRGVWPRAVPTRCPIGIDDQDSSDISPDFCSLSVLVEEKGPHLTLYLKNPPLDDNVKKLIMEKNGTISGGQPHQNIEIPLKISQVVFLRELAKAIRGITGKGRRYENSNWKWVCPRTANSLNRLADRLMEFRKQRQHSYAGVGNERVPSIMVAPPATSTVKSGKREELVVKPEIADEDEEDIFRRLEMA